MAINVFRYHIEVAADHDGKIILQPHRSLFLQAVHPCQFVVKLFRSYRIPIRQVDVHDADAVDIHLEETRMAVCFVTEKRRTQYVKRPARQDRDTVVGFLRDSNALIAEFFERSRGESPCLLIPVITKHRGFSPVTIASRVPFALEWSSRSNWQLT